MEEDGEQVNDILTLFWNNPILSSAKFNYHCTKLAVVVDFESKRHARVIFGIYKKGEAPVLEKTEQLRDILSMRQSLGVGSEDNSQKEANEVSNDEYYSTHETDDAQSTEGDRHEEDEVPEDSLTEKFFSTDEVSGGEVVVDNNKVKNAAIDSA
ncbi:hypothetical protein HW132_35340 [Brasilonema sp. CT11]|nr:hypothetical protein [Brasilonema sp. CT11]